MEISEALNEVIKFKNLFRAAEKLEEALTEVANLQGKKAGLEAEIKAAEKDRDEAKRKAESQVEALRQIDKDVERARVNFGRQLDAAKKQFDADMKALGEEYSRASVAAKQKIADDLKAEQDKVNELTAIRGNLQREIRALQAFPAK